MKSEQIVECAGDVLYSRRVVAQGCFATNVAAIELKRHGLAALPIIEDLIRAEVVPVAARGLGHHELSTEFTGLASLWVAYLKLAGRGQGARAAAFLRTLEDPLPFTAALAAQPAFRTVPKQASDLEIPRELWEFFDGLRARTSGGDRMFLDRLLAGFYRAASPPAPAK